jgi:thiamine biosynthesis protein ThiS
MTIAAIMEEKSYHFKMLIVKLNGSIIAKEAFSSTPVKEGDRLDIIHLISGG